MGNFSQPFLQQDLIENYSFPQTGRTRGFFFGARSNIGNTRVDLWEGPTDRYVFPSAPMQMQVVSSSANDTANGTGARTVSMEYLDTNLNIQTTIITMNGTTPVLTVPTDIYRINYFHTETVGSGGYAAGNISVQSVGGAVTYEYLSAGRNISLSGFFTIPSDAVMAYGSHWQYSSGSTGIHFCAISLEATCHRGDLKPGVFIVQDVGGTLNGGDSVNYPTPLPLPPGTDIKFTAISDQSNAAVSAYAALSGFGETDQARKMY